MTGSDSVKMIGVEERDHGGIHIVRLHYSADPEKRSACWLAAAKEGYPGERMWRREMEIDWTIASGLPVYADEFVRDWHVAREALSAHPKLPIYRGFDFGLSPACVWAQVDTMGRINVIAEHVTWTGRGDMRQLGIERFAPEVIRLSNEWFPSMEREGKTEFIDYADPAGWSKAQTDERTCIEILQAKGIHPRKGPVTFTARRRAMTECLGQAIGGRAKLLISPDCSMLIEGFQGAYRFEQIGETGRYREDVEKNAWSHPMDALEYVVGGIFGAMKHEDKRNRRGRVGRPERVTGY